MLKTEGVNHVIAQSVNHVSLDMVAAPTGYWAEFVNSRNRRKVSAFGLTRRKGTTIMVADG